MKIIGVDLKGSEAILASIHVDEGEISYQPRDPKKLKLESSSTEDIKNFVKLFWAFAKDADAGSIAIKGRKKIGGFAGGGDSFIMEGAIQATAEVPVTVIQPPTIAAQLKKSPVESPSALNAYQNGAFEVACTLTLRDA